MILCGILVLVVVMLATMINHFERRNEVMYPNLDYVPNQTPSRTLDFSLIDNSIYNPAIHEGIPYYLDNSDGKAIMTIGGFIVKGTYVGWVHIWDIEGMNLVADANEFSSLCDIDFNQSDLIVSFGREITEMQCYRNNSYPDSFEVLAVTYSEPHHGSKVFFYQIPKTSIVYHGLEAPYYFEGQWQSGKGNLGIVADWERAQQVGYGDGK